MSRRRTICWIASVLIANAIGACAGWAAVPTEFQPKYDAGYSTGYPVGYKSGFSVGHVRGWNSGWDAGHSDGYDTGWDEAYPLAFDIGYDEQFPIGHRNGWDDGLVAGFKRGFEWAPVVAAEFFGVKYNSGLFGEGFFGLTMVSSLGKSWGSDAASGSVFSVQRFDNFQYDWAKHYYDEGFTDGKAAGYSVGNEAGYHEAYPVAYERAFPLGQKSGVWEGTSTGKREGGDQGYDDGWSKGYGVAWDEGFYAGLDYHLFGAFIEPKYSLQYTRRGNAAMASTLVAMNAPEPGTALLLAIGGAFSLAAVRRSR